MWELGTHKRQITRQSFDNGNSYKITKYVHQCIRMGEIIDINKRQDDKSQSCSVKKLSL